MNNYLLFLAAILTFNNLQAIDVSQYLQEKLKIQESSSTNGTVPTRVSGSSKIEMIKAKNREVLRQRKEKAQIRPESPSKEPVSLQEQVRSNLLKLKSQNKSFLLDLKKKQVEFLSKLPSYKEAMIDVEQFESSGKTPILPKTSPPVLLASSKQFHIIKGATAIQIRDQGKRSTCSAFAGIRAIETKLLAKGVKTDLSEQFFYWLGKPKCRQSPCSKKGSWVSIPFQETQNGKYFLPEEADCPYNPAFTGKNTAQTPLSPSCKKGKVKVNKFFKISTYAEIISNIQKDHPVVLGLPLDDAFYKNDGVVTLSQFMGNKISDKHKKGHAITAIGFFSLKNVQDQYPNQGGSCLLVANSWGEGWGYRGYACLTEKWVKRYLNPKALIVLTEVQKSSW